MTSLPGEVLNKELSQAIDELKNDPDGIDKLRENIVGNIPLETLGLITTDYIFGDKLDSPDEKLYLEQSLDPTDNIQAELINRIDVLCEEQSILQPDNYLLQVYHRQTGFKIPKKTSYKYSAVLVLTGFQYFQIGISSFQLIPSGKMTKLFDHSVFRPSVPKVNLIKLDNGKATLKRKDFRAIVLWLFWSEYPVQTKIDPTQLEATLQKLIAEKIEATPGVESLITTPPTIEL